MNQIQPIAAYVPYFVNVGNHEVSLPSSTASFVEPSSFFN